MPNSDDIRNLDHNENRAEEPTRVTLSAPRPTKDWRRRQPNTRPKGQVFVLSDYGTLERVQ